MFDDIINQIILFPWKGWLLAFTIALTGFYIGILVQTSISRKEHKKAFIELKRQVEATFQKDIDIISRLSAENIQLKKELQRRAENETEDKTS